MHDIFISYSSKDENTAKSVCRYLERHGLTCWISCRDNEFGDNYLSKINTAIRNSNAFTVLVSKNSIDSEQVANELAIANSEIKNGLKRFPILFDSDLDPDQLDGVLGYFLTGIHMCHWDSLKEQKLLIKQLGTELNLELDPSTGRFVREHSDFYNDYKPLPEETVYESNLHESDPLDDIEPIYTSEEDFPVYPSRDSIIKSQISIAVLLMLFFLGSTFVLCGCAKFYSFLFEEFAYPPDAMDYLSSQIRNLLTGAVLFLVCWKLPTNYLKKAIPYLTAIFVVATLLVKEYHPWISINSFHFVPANFGPWCLILLFSWILSKYPFINNGDRFYISKSNHLYLVFFVTAIYFALSFEKYGFFSVLLALVLGFGITFVFESNRKKHYFLAIALAFVCLLFIISLFNGMAEAWGMNEVWVDYLCRRLTPPEIITEAIQATTFGSGGFSTDIFKAGLLPLSDNIFLTLFHMGWSVAIVIVLLYCFLLLHVYRIAKACMDSHNYYEGIICFGVLIHIGFCAAYHICMNLNLLPITGCPLPFISDWGNEFLFAEMGCVFAAAKKGKIS